MLFDGILEQLTKLSIPDEDRRLVALCLVHLQELLFALFVQELDEGNGQEPNENRVSQDRQSFCLSLLIYALPEIILLLSLEVIDSALAFKSDFVFLDHLQVIRVEKP